MEEQFVLRVPPSVAQRLHNVLDENSEAGEDDIDLSFGEDGRTGKFKIGNDEFEVSLVDLPCVVESYKTYDHTVMIKTADIGQMILVKDQDAPPQKEVSTEYRHGLTPAMRDTRRRRFRRQADLDPEYVQQIEKDLMNIMAGGTARDVDILVNLVTFDVSFVSALTVTHVEVLEQEEDVEEEPVQQKSKPEPSAKPANAVQDKPKAAATQEAEGSSSDDGEYYEDSET